MENEFSNRFPTRCLKCGVRMNIVYLETGYKKYEELTVHEIRCPVRNNTKCNGLLVPQEEYDSYSPELKIYDLK
jgi:hypothetical protein